MLPHRILNPPEWPLGAARAARENIASAQDRAPLQGVFAANNGTTPHNAFAWDTAPAARSAQDSISCGGHQRPETTRLLSRCAVAVRESGVPGRGRRGAHVPRILRHLGHRAERRGGRPPHPLRMRWPELAGRLDAGFDCSQPGTLLHADGGAGAHGVVAAGIQPPPAAQCARLPAAGSRDHRPAAAAGQPRCPSGDDRSNIGTGTTTGGGSQAYRLSAHQYSLPASRCVGEKCRLASRLLMTLPSNEPPGSRQKG